MRRNTTVPVAPAQLRLLVRPLPLLPLQRILQRMTQSMANRRPGVFLRLEQHATKTFLIDPTDMPFVFRLRPCPGRPTIELRRRADTGPWHSRVAGPIAALIGMIHGAYDGDALFFSRDIVIEGDTEAVLALRNALDDTEIDLPAEAIAALGPAGPLFERMARQMLPPVERLTGLALIRRDGR